MVSKREVGEVGSTIEWKWSNKIGIDGEKEKELVKPCGIDLLEIVETLKSGEDLEQCWVRTLKEMLWMLVATMGRGGFLVWNFCSTIFEQDARTSLV
jgi:hypothetical protein